MFYLQFQRVHYIYLGVPALSYSSLKLHCIIIFSRDPSSIVAPVKLDSPAEQNRYNSEIEKAKGTAWRHIFLIRHGQYNVNGASDREQKLTDLGNNKIVSVSL